MTCVQSSWEMKFIFHPDKIFSGWLGLKYQLTNFLIMHVCIHVTSYVLPIVLMFFLFFFFLSPRHSKEILRFSSGRIFFSRVNVVCWLLLGVCSTPMLLQRHVKDQDHSAESAGGRLHLNTHTPLTHWSQSGPTVLLSRQSVGIYQETSSHATCLGTLGYSLSSLSRCGQILA